LQHFDSEASFNQVDASKWSFKLSQVCPRMLMGVRIDDGFSRVLEFRVV
jgi:hypothetical protein